MIGKLLASSGDLEEVKGRLLFNRAPGKPGEAITDPCICPRVSKIVSKELLGRRSNQLLWAMKNKRQ